MIFIIIAATLYHGIWIEHPLKGQDGIMVFSDVHECWEHVSVLKKSTAEQKPYRENVHKYFWCVPQ